ncbi:MAG: metal ABC transporter permease [Bdellovibrionales bacterium]
MVGVYVVFASLIMPALAAVKSMRPYLVAWLCGIISVALGVTVSAGLDLPAGPVIVVSYSAVAILMTWHRRELKCFD